jgi:adenylate cyclase
VERELRRMHNELRLNLEGRRNDMDEAIGALTDRATKDAERRQTSLVVITLTVTAGAVGAGLMLAWVVTRRMVQPVQTLMAGVQNVEKGDLTVNLPVRSSDEIGALTAYFNRLVEELRSKERMKETFGKYIDPRIVEKVILNPGSAETEGGRRVMTISFCDLVGFTGIGEHLTPSGLVRLLNRHFEYLAGAIHQHQGVVDKFMGDAVMAFWGPPFTASGDHATLACRAALAQLEVLDKLCAELPELTGLRRNIPTLDLRIGLASGEVVVGNIGADSARAYTVIGDTVNLASRLESVNRLYQTRILLSGETRKLAAEAIEAREIDSIAVKGKSEPAVVFELMGLAGSVPQRRITARERYEEGLAAYRKLEWDAAQTALRGVLEIAPSDGPAKLLLSRIPQMQASPPAAGWDGVWHMVEK